jgi:UrcA family protein
MRYLPLRLAAAAGFAAAAALATAAPAFAQNLDRITVTAGAPAIDQDDLDGITDTAHALRTRPQSISEDVSYAGLDLNSPHDREVLLTLVNVAAGRICEQLNEPSPSAGNLGHSCQEIAVRGAMSQIHQAYAQAGSPADAAANGQPASARVNDTTAGGN